MRGLSQTSRNLPDGVFADCSTWKFDALFSVSAGVIEIIEGEGYCEEWPNGAAFKTCCTLTIETKNQKCCSYVIFWLSCSEWLMSCSWAPPLFWLWLHFVILWITFLSKYVFKCKIMKTVTQNYYTVSQLCQCSSMKVNFSLIPIITKVKMQSGLANVIKYILSSLNTERFMG